MEIERECTEFYGNIQKRDLTLSRGHRSPLEYLNCDL